VPVLVLTLTYAPSCSGTCLGRHPAWVAVWLAAAASAAFAAINAHRAAARLHHGDRAGAMVALGRAAWWAGAPALLLVLPIAAAIGYGVSLLGRANGVDANGVSGCTGFAAIILFLVAGLGLLYAVPALIAGMLARRVLRRLTTQVDAESL